MTNRLSAFFKYPKEDSIRQQSDAPTQNVGIMNMFSPRNIATYISNSIDDFNTRPKKYIAQEKDQQELLESFEPFCKSFQKQYKKYKQLASKRMNQHIEQKHEDLQNQLMLSKIPEYYFDAEYELYLTCRMNKQGLRKAQEQIIEHLDKIQILLFYKTSKDPQRYFKVIGNYDQTLQMVNNALVRVKTMRTQYLSKIKEIQQKRKNILAINKKKQRLLTCIEHLNIAKRMKNMKNLSLNNRLQNNSEEKLSILQKIKQKQVNICNKLIALKDIVENLQFYRQEIKLKMYNRFSTIVEKILQKILYYNKQDWNSNKITANLLTNNQNDAEGPQKGKQSITNNLLEQSKLNITVLDQSYFAFTTQAHQQQHQHQILTTIKQQQQQQQQASGTITNEIVYLNKPTMSEILQLETIWKDILHFDLYDSQEVNQLLMKILIRHNTVFNQDLDEYLGRLFEEFLQPILEEENSVENTSANNQNQQQSTKAGSQEQSTIQQISKENKEKDKVNSSSEPLKKTAGGYLSSLSEGMTNNLKDLNDLGNIKNKAMSTFKRFGNLNKKSQHSAKVTTKKTSEEVILEEKQTKQNSIKIEQKLSKVDIKLFLKAVKFYYEILSSLIKFMKSNSQLEFMLNFQEKLHQFIESRVKFFFSLRNISQKIGVNEFLCYMDLIDYWIDVSEQVYESLSSLKATVIDQYLTCLQKNILVKGLKQAIQNSKFNSQSISSDNISSFNYVINWQNIQTKRQQQGNDLSVTMIHPHHDYSNYQQQLNSTTNTQKLSNIHNQQQQEDSTSRTNQFRIIDKQIFYRNDQYCICESFLPLIKQLQKYLQLRAILTFYNENIEQKICEIIGFYVWFNQKTINNPNRTRSLTNLCVIYFTVSFLKLIFDGQLNIKSKKRVKTTAQFQEFFTNIQESITMTPFLLIEKQIANMYQSNSLASQFEIPTKQTLKIIDLLRLSLQQLKIHFAKQRIIKILQPTIKMIHKNYFGYLSSLGKRGLLELKEFIPKYKDCLLDYGFKQSKLPDKTANKSTAQSTTTSTTSYIFLKELIQMQKIYKSKVAQYK